MPPRVCLQPLLPCTYQEVWLTFHGVPPPVTYRKFLTLWGFGLPHPNEGLTPSHEEVSWHLVTKDNSPSLHSNMLKRGQLGKSFPQELAFWDLKGRRPPSAS